MVEQILDRRPLILVPVEALQDEVLSLLGDVAPVLFFRIDKLNWFLTDVLVNFFDAAGLEWSMPREELVSDHSQAPHVDLLSVRLSLHELRCHVQRTPEDESHLLLRLLGETEVRYLDIKVVHIF